MKCVRVIIKGMEDCLREQLRICSGLRVSETGKKPTLPAKRTHPFADVFTYAQLERTGSFANE